MTLAVLTRRGGPLSYSRGRGKRLNELWPDLALGGLAADFADFHLPEAAGHLQGSAAPGTAQRAPRNLFNFTSGRLPRARLAWPPLSARSQQQVQTSQEALAQMKNSLARHRTPPVRLKDASLMFDLCGKHTQVMSFC